MQLRVLRQSLKLLAQTGADWRKISEISCASQSPEWEPPLGGPNWRTGAKLRSGGKEEK